MIVDLPAPFSPSRATISRRAEVERQVVDGDGAAERLADAPNAEQLVRDHSASDAGVVEHVGRVGETLPRQHSGRSSGTLA